MSSDEGGLLQVIEKQEMMNVNPYVLVMEDKSMMNVYSMIDQAKHYRFKVEECKWFWF